jgi:hypothetical protein
MMQVMMIEYIGKIEKFYYVNNYFIFYTDICLMIRWQDRGWVNAPVASSIFNPPETAEHLDSHSDESEQSDE